MIRCIVTIGALSFECWAASTIDAINDARDRVGFGPAISARAAA
jgi:hypothetical protein